MKPTYPLPGIYYEEQIARHAAPRREILYISNADGDSNNNKWVFIVRVYCPIISLMHEKLEDYPKLRLEIDPPQHVESFPAF